MEGHEDPERPGEVPVTPWPAPPRAAGDRPTCRSRAS